MYRKILLLNLCIFIVGCSRWQMKDEIKSFLGKTVCFPNNLIAVHNGIALSDSLISDGGCPIKLVLYFSANRCTPCVIGKFRDYEKIFKMEVENQFSPLIILSTKEEKYEYKTLVSELVIRSLPYPVYVDRYNEFQQLNTCLPSDSRFHTFLLDKNNKVALIGNPLNGDAMWNLFKSTLENMLAHDGEYVPEN